MNRRVIIVEDIVVRRNVTCYNWSQIVFNIIFVLISINTTIHKR